VLGRTPTNQELCHAAALLRTELAPCRRTERHPTGVPLNEASRQLGVDQPHGRTSAGDTSENLHACRGAAAVEEVAAECGSVSHPVFKDQTECITICMPGSNSIHIVTSSVNNQQQYHEKRIKRL
jgi:hypothetical protein